MSIKIIAAVGKNLELGKRGDLCFHIKEDMAYFREMTLHHHVIMGRKTWESLGKRPLKDRKNYVVSRSDLSMELPAGVTSVTDLKKTLKSYADPQKNSDTNILFVIGGASIYAAALPYADEILLTEIDASDREADTFFPSFDKSKYTRTILKKGKENDLTYSFVSYKRK